MSCIAYDGRRIAFDTQAGVGNRMDREPWMKMVTLDVNVSYKYAGGCGEAGIIAVFVEWMRQGSMDGYPKLCSDNASDVYFIAITHDGEFHEFERSEEPVLKTRLPEAIGSGGHYALGAMLAGVEAKEAVEIASRCDPYTNDDVHELPCC